MRESERDRKMKTNGTEGVSSQYANSHFWLGTVDRAVAALGQTAVVFFTAGISGILEVDAVQLFSVIGLAVAASIATSLAYPKRVITGEDPEAAAKVVKEYLSELYEDGIIHTRDSEKVTHYDINDYSLLKDDGSYITRKELRALREAEEQQE